MMMIVNCEALARQVKNHEGMLKTGRVALLYFILSLGQA